MSATITTMKTMDGKTIRYDAPLCDLNHALGAMLEQTGETYALFIKGMEDEVVKSTVIPPDAELFCIPRDNTLIEGVKLVYKTLYLLSCVIFKCDQFTGSSRALYEILLQPGDAFYDEDSTSEMTDLYNNTKAFLNELSNGTPCAINTEFGGYSFYDKPKASSILSELGLTSFLASGRNDIGRNDISGCYLVYMLPSLFTPIELEWIPQSHFDNETWSISDYDGSESIDFDHAKLELIEKVNESVEISEILYSTDLSAEEKIAQLKGIIPEN